MENTRITKKDRFIAIKEVLAGAGASEDLTAFCDAEIALLDKKAAAAKAAKAKRQEAADELTNAVAEALTDEFTSIAGVTARISGDDVTTSKVQYRLNKLVEANVAERGEVLVPGVDGGKARKLVGFRKAN